MRNFDKIIKDICLECNIDLKEISSSWIKVLKKDKKTRYIIGYNFDLNTTSEILSNNGIDNIFHVYCPSFEVFSKTVLEYLKKGEVILKSNVGSGGRKVFKVSNFKEAKKVYDDLKVMGEDVVVCPFYNFDNEYRVIVLDNEVKLVYCKERSFTLVNGNKVYKTFKHNLEQGAKAILVSNFKLKKVLGDIALKVSNCLNVRFASIDIALIDNEYKVVEVNSKVMMEYFSSSSDVYYNISKDIYKEAILLMFK